MMKNIILLILLATIGTIPDLLAQQAFPSSAGEATGSGGKVSYATGLIAYKKISGPGGTAIQGIEQPFEIFVLGKDLFTSVSLSAIIYPNPTVSSVSLRIEFSDMLGLRYELFDFHGRLLAEDTITHTETIIPMGNLSDATYILNVHAGKYPLKSFKIIKKNR